MLKEEFEQRIGKEVDVNIFELYNAMYMSTDLHQDDFCKLLNFEAIPESDIAIQAKKRNAERKEGYMAQMADAKKRIAHYKEQLTNDYTYVKDVPYYKKMIKQERLRLKELKFLLSL